jgi:hypothetical protein
MRLGSTFRLVVSMTAVGTILLVAAPPARAMDMNAVWPDLNLPGFKITPFITERGEYQANVLLQPRNELDDFISRTIFGAVVELPFGRHRLDLSARAELLRFINNTQFDNEHYFLLANLALIYPGGLRIGVREEFVKTSDPPGTELTGRIESTTNTVALEAEYALAGRLSIGTNYAYTRVRFDTVPQLDRDEHTVGVTGFWKVTAKSDLLANVSYGVKDFESVTARDAERFFGTVGLRGDVTSRLSSTFRVGYEHREEGGGRSSNAFVSSGDWTFVPTERTRFTLLTQRSFEESTFASNNTFTASLLTLLVQHRFGPKLTFNGRLFTGLNEYPNLDLDVNRFHRRSDFLLGAGLGLDYQIQRWLAVGADYTFGDRKSNFRNFDYTDHVIGVKVTLSL